MDVKVRTTLPYPDFRMIPNLRLMTSFIFAETQECREKHRQLPPGKNVSQGCRAEEEEGRSWLEGVSFALWSLLFYGPDVFFFFVYICGICILLPTTEVS
jgi:hypothetical protein